MSLSFHSEAPGCPVLSEILPGCLCPLRDSLYDILVLSETLPIVLVLWKTLPDVLVLSQRVVRMSSSSGCPRPFRNSPPEALSRLPYIYRRNLTMGRDVHSKTFEWHSPRVLGMQIYYHLWRFMSDQSGNKDSSWIKIRCINLDFMKARLSSADSRRAPQNAWNDFPHNL